MLHAAKLYYRLVETDKDGVMIYSNIIRIAVVNDAVSVFIAPNPLNNIIVIHSDITMNNALIRISDINGQTRYLGKHTIYPATTLSLDASRLARGSYVVTIQSGNFRKVITVIK